MVFILASCISLSSCGALVKMKAKKYATIEQGAIPKDFGKDDMAMLFIRRSKRSYDKYLKRNIEKEYRGNYKLIDFSELLTDEYKNLDRYPYYFDYKNTSSSYRSPRNTIYGPAGSTRNRVVKVFSITDRKVKKTYQLKMTSGFWSKLQRVYIKNMQVERAKHQSF